MSRDPAPARMFGDESSEFCQVQLQEFRQKRETPILRTPMSGSRIVFDGLWRCLCPSVDAHAAAKLLSSPAIARPSPATRPRFPSTLTTRPRAVRTQCRGYGGGAYHEVATQKELEDARSRLVPVKDEPPARQRPRDPSKPDPIEALRAAPEAAVYEALEVLRGQPKSFEKVATIITHLVTDRDAELSPALYEHLVVAMADVHGSAAMLAQLFAEMRELHLPPSPAIHHAALAVRYQKRKCQIS